MKHSNYFKWVRILLIIGIIIAYSFLSRKISPLKISNLGLTDTIYHNFDTIYITPKPKPKPIASLTIEELWDYYVTNPCYLPLIKDTALWEKGKRVGFEYEDLFNDSLSEGHKYSNRYLVGDFNVLDQKGRNRKIQEIYPKLELLKEFDSIPDDIVLKMDSIHFGTAAYDSLIREINIRVPNISNVLINFLEKVWNYKMLAVTRDYSINGNNLYAAGQTIVMCEACEDTLIMIGRFATSSKRINIGNRYMADGSTEEYYFEHLPTGNTRSYYAGLNTMSSKHWESARSYDIFDIIRDAELGGGHNRIVKYRDKVELPNLLSIKPTSDYPNAMNGNGIHEVALSYVSRGMLGTSNSIGCLRVSDFASKFLRWWVPQDCKLFIAYSETCLHKEIKYKGAIEDYLPFKTEKEGNDFRNWINTYKPDYAKLLQIDKDGDYRNGYIIDGYYNLQDEYNEYLKQKDSLKNQNGIFKN